MADSSPDLIQTLKKLMKDTTNASYPSDWLLGTVVAVSPLEIQIEQREILSAEFFKLTHAVVDYYVDIEVNHVTENRAGGSGEPAFASHNHDYIGRKKIMIYNGLKVDEQVILLQKQGGQDFLILDRVFDPQVSGQWL